MYGYRGRQKSYNRASDGTRAMAQAAKRRFLKDHPDAVVRIDGRNGFIIVNGKKAVNISSASGRPMQIEDLVARMKETLMSENTMKITRAGLRQLIKESMHALGMKNSPDFQFEKAFRSMRSWGASKKDLDDMETVRDLYMQDLPSGAPSRALQMHVRGLDTIVREEIPFSVYNFIYPSEY